VLGYLAYHVSQRWRPREGLAALIWLTSLILIPLCSWIEIHFRTHLDFLRTTDQTVGEILAAYAGAACFTFNLLAFDALAARAGWLLTPCAAAIRWLGSITFALYLFHEPLLSLFTVYHMPDRSSLAQLVLLVGGTFLVVGTFGRFCEMTKGTYKQWLLTLGSRLAAPAPIAGAAAGQIQPPR
jgi:peptidoglycan/LPS O-acetylase OafA/YrhL